MRSNRSRNVLLASYKDRVTELNDLAQEWNLSEKQFNTILKTSLNDLERKSLFRRIIAASHVCTSLIPLVVSIVFITTLITVYITISYHKPSYNMAARNIQDYIYPIMKMLRHFSIPIVKAYPSITAIYDESCLIENPLFNYRKVDCWPCTDVFSPIDLSDYNEDPKTWQPHSAYPYFIKNVSAEVSYAGLREMYWQQADMFNRDAYKIKSSVNEWTKIHHLMNIDLGREATEKQDAHVTWQINRLEPSRAVRQLFKRPKFVPPWVTVQRFILFDEPNSPAYDTPMMESFSVFVMQSSGERLLVLEPVFSCRSHCSTIAIHMKPSYFLFYSNLYYTLKSLPVSPSKNIFRYNQRKLTGIVRILGRPWGCMC